MIKEVENMLDDAARARQQGGLETARAAFEQALEAATLAHDDHGRLVALKGLAQLERDLGRPENALNHYYDATRAAQRIGDTRLVAWSLRHHAEACRESGRVKEAEPLIAQAISLYREQDDVPGLEMANALRPAALLCEDKGDPLRAAKYWEEARTLYQAAGVDAGVNECAEGLARCGCS